MTHQEIEYDRHATFKLITQLHNPVLQVKERSKRTNFNMILGHLVIIISDLKA